MSERSNNNSNLNGNVVKAKVDNDKKPSPWRHLIAGGLVVII